MARVGPQRHRKQTKQTKCFVPYQNKRRFYITTFLNEGWLRYIQTSVCLHPVKICPLEHRRVTVLAVCSYVSLYKAIVWIDHGHKNYRKKNMFVVQVRWAAPRVFQKSHTFPVHWSNTIRKMSCIRESFTNSSPRLLCREKKLFFYQLVPQCIADSPDAVRCCFIAQPVAVVQVHRCIATCEKITYKSR